MLAAGRSRWCNFVPLPAPDGRPVLFERGEHPFVLLTHVNAVLPLLAPLSTCPTQAAIDKLRATDAKAADGLQRRRDKKRRPHWARFADHRVDNSVLHMDKILATSLPYLLHRDIAPPVWSHAMLHAPRQWLRQLIDIPSRIANGFVIMSLVHPVHGDLDGGRGAGTDLALLLGVDPLNPWILLVVPVIPVELGALRSGCVIIGDLPAADPTEGAQDLIDLPHMADFTAVSTLRQHANIHPLAAINGAGVEADLLVCMAQLRNGLVRSSACLVLVLLFFLSCGALVVDLSSWSTPTSEAVFMHLPSSFSFSFL